MLGGMLQCPGDSSASADSTMSASLVILGATGMLGQALCREGRKREVQVTGIARTGSDQNVDASDVSALHAALDAASPSVIINAAAQTDLGICEQDPGQAYVVNARLPALLADYCTAHRIKLVQVSTDHYFSGDANQLHDEQAPVTLLNEYARTKYAGEIFAALCPDSLILRTNLVGFRGWADKPTFVEWAIAALRGHRPMTLFADFHTSSIDVDHFASALFALLERDACGLMNVAARTPASKEEFVLKLARRFGLDAGCCRSGSVREIAGPRRAESLALDVRRAESALGTALPDTDAVIDALAHTYEEHYHAVR